MYRYINGIVITCVRARPCATNREESYPKKVTHGPKSLSRYNDIVVSHIVIKGFYCTLYSYMHSLVVAYGDSSAFGAVACKTGFPLGPSEILLCPGQASKPWYNAGQ